VSPTTVAQIGEMFSPMSGRYDQFNRWASMGLDGSWRQTIDRRLKYALKSCSGSIRVLDLGSGTGVLAFQVGRLHWHVVGVDISHGMLRYAQDSDRQRNHNGRGDRAIFDWVGTDAGNMPFPDQTFQAVVSAFVLRNLNEARVLSNALMECYRVLKPDGVAFLLDLTQPPGLLLRCGHYVYSKTVLPVLGSIAFGRHWPGSYLFRTMREFPRQHEVVKELSQIGFRKINATHLSGGIATLYEIQK